ncbi:MAG: ATP-binding cassette domain-containing protein [Bifidobacteriaceae bacterium]|jgi:D-xylose transport system ATP-binding protein|nr:ATP-binding cassette domain-containing protein [Bifidobacteriaceae bacterium]
MKNNSNATWSRNAAGPHTASARRPVLALRKVSKAFRSVKALNQIDFDIYPREVVAVVGDNAAGKSVLAKTIAGLYQPDSGQIYWDGLPETIPNPSAAQDMGVASVFQELALCDNLTIMQNMFLGRELARRNVLSEEKMELRARQVLADLGARLPSVHTLVSTLSAGQRQITAIARALLGSPRLLIMDEPTSSLSVAQTAEVLNLIERLRDLGYGVMFISHTLADVQAVADRVVIMRHGRINGEGQMRDTSYEDIIAAITGAPNDLTRAIQRRGALVAPTAA